MGWLRAEGCLCSSCCLLGKTPHEETNRALESSSGYKSEQEGAKEPGSERLQLTQVGLYSSRYLQRDLDGPYGLVLTLKSSYALPTAAITVAGSYSLLFLALGGWNCEAAQPRNEMHQMETIWKEHPTLTLRATWKRTFKLAKKCLPTDKQPSLKCSLHQARVLGAVTPQRAQC